MRLALPGGDLCICFRAAAIDTAALMNEVSEEQLFDWFLYTREVDALVADRRSRKTGRLVRLLVANDFTGISRFPDTRFVRAVVHSSREAEALYPGFPGPIVILNPPA